MSQNKTEITLKNFEIVEIVNQLESADSILKSTSQDKKLPISILWIIDGNYRTLKSYFERIQEKEQAINQEYFNDEKSELNSDGYREVKVEFREEFLKAKNDLFAIENTISIEKVQINQLEGYNFIPSDFNSIRFMLTDSTDDEQVQQVPEQI